jgi:hemoglobin
MRLTTGWLNVLLGATFLLVLRGTPMLAQEMKQEKSLYERLGGVHAIAAVVDDFIDRIWVNKVLNENPKNKEASGIKKPALKYLATELVCQVTGGPQKYTGRPLRDVHQGLNISEREWDAMVVDFKATLGKFNVPAKEQEELLAIVGSTKGDIVMAAKQEEK